MAHGGSFVGGDRTQTEEFGFDFAKRGYICANIEYRLLDMLVWDSIGLTEAVFMAINDMRAAVRFFKEDASNSNTYGTSLDHIFVAGVSAGAIMADQMGVRNEFYLVSNSTGHVSYFYNDTTKKEVLDESSAFLSSIICEGTTHAAEELSVDHSKVSVYPNPFRDILNIQSEATILEITVTNLSGQIFLQTGLSSGNSLELGKLPSGIYLLRIKTEKNIHMRKVLKE